MWQPPTSPAAGDPAGSPPSPGPSAPSWQQPAPVPPWAQGQAPGQWFPPPGGWWPPPPKPPRSRKVVVLVVAACVLGVVLLGAAVVGAFALGQAAADRSSASASTAVTPRPPVAATGLGDDAQMNAQATQCHDGDMQACDDLFEQSEPMSRYEQYGMTCGGRVKPFDVDYCTDLN